LFLILELHLLCRNPGYHVGTCYDFLPINGQKARIVASISAHAPVSTVSQSLHHRP
jgi:hypothetical protein